MSEFEKFEDRFVESMRKIFEENSEIFRGCTGTSATEEKSLDIDDLKEMIDEIGPQPNQKMLLTDADYMRTLIPDPVFREYEPSPLDRSMFYGLPVYGIEKVIRKEIVQRRHKKRRINKKLNKKYGRKVKVLWVKNQAHHILHVCS